VIEDYCRRVGLDLRDVHVDLGVSGATNIADRPGGLELCRVLSHRSARGSHVVVARVDRAWRKASDALLCVDDWTRHGIGVHLVNLPIPHVTSPEGRLMLGMLAIFAEWERGQISERTTAAIQHRRRKMLKYNKVVPIGFRLGVGGALLPEHEDCLTLYLIDRWVNETRLSTGRVAGRLTECDRPLPPGGGIGDVWVDPDKRRPSVLSRSWIQKTVWSAAKRMRDDEQYRAMVLREVVSARASGWTEPDPLGQDIRERLA